MCVSKGTRQSTLTDLRDFATIVTRVDHKSGTKDYGKTLSLSLKRLSMLKIKKKEKKSK